MTPSATWTDDCQGKKDYDGPLLSICTRYWPSAQEQAAGNHVNLLTPAGNWVSHPYESSGRPSATASIILNHGDPELQAYTTWREQDFVADTQEEVKRQVEEWVQEQFNTICWLLGIKEPQ